jgi:hypothetical protein
MSTDDFDRVAADGEELFAGLYRSVAGAGMSTSAADVVALGRRTRTRHRAVAAGIGTSAAALVAAIGVLAPSAGTGAGGTQNAAGRPAQGAVIPGAGTNTNTGAQVLDIQEAGFSLQEQADGTVTMNLGAAFDPNKLQAAMDKAGIPAAILIQQVPDGWDMGRGIQCTPDPGVHPVGPSATEFFKGIFGPSKADVQIIKSKIPAGDFITLMRFEQHGRNMGGEFGAFVGRQTTCVPEYGAASDPVRH